MPAVTLLLRLALRINLVNMTREGEAGLDCRFQYRTEETSMTFKDWEGFLSTLGDQFCDVLAKAGINDASGQDCYSAIVDALGTKDITPDTLRSFSPETMANIAAAMNRFFETKSIKPSHVAMATENTLRHWS
jgi:hypothetical protein